jgi:hypothetical protein
MEILWTIEDNHRPYFESGHTKVYRKRKKTHVAYKTKIGKKFQTFSDHNFKIRA